MKNLRTTLFVIVSLFVLLVIFIFRSVSAPTSDNKVEVTGIVSSIYEGGPNLMHGRIFR